VIVPFPLTLLILPCAMTESNKSLATQSSVQPGGILADKYRLEYEIGRGAMGTVWSAMHLTLDQRVAIKVISREHANSTDLRRRFSTEAKAAAKLRSRYVVGVYDDGETSEGLPYIVMEYLEGECLEDRIARNGSIPLAEATRIAKHIGRALSRAHARGIVHRDLKPANVFITQSEDDDELGWIAKVLDFGIAKMEDIGEKSATKTGTVLGTPLFMSPEQVRGASAVDHRADLYSLGMVVYNMVTGTYAFDGASFGDLLVSICTDPLPSMREAAPWVPESLDKWFKKACARDPSQRFAHAEEMIEALGEATGTAVSGRHSMVDSRALDEALSSFAKTQAGVGIGPRKPGEEGASSYVAAKSANGLSSASPATVTVHQVPTKSKLPWVLGAAGVGLALALVLAFSGGDAKDASNGVESSAVAQQPAAAKSEPVTEPSAPREATSAASPAESAPTPKVDEKPAASADEKSSLPSSSTTPISGNTKTTPGKSKPAVGKPIKSALVKTPAHTSTAAAPEKPPAKAPSKAPSEPDLGF
jgi:serine/threonine-protein kinase